MQGWVIRLRVAIRPDQYGLGHVTELGWLKIKALASMIKGLDLDKDWAKQKVVGFRPVSEPNMVWASMV